MSLVAQIKILLLAVVFLLPVIPVYLFFPYTDIWDKNKIEIYETLGVGIIVSTFFWFILIFIYYLVIVFPLLALLIIAGIFILVKKNYRKVVNKGLENYIRLHKNKKRGE